MKITESFLTLNQYSRPQKPLEKVTKIAVHYVGNPNTSAAANRSYFEGLKSQIPDKTNTYRLNPDGTYMLDANGNKIKLTYVSSHFLIGLQGEIIQNIPLNEWSYCTNQANGYSISIECCHPDSTGKFNEATEQSLAELCAYLLEKFGLGADDIIRHYDVTGKQCPLYWSPTKYQSAEVANARFKEFKDKVAALMKKDKPADTAAKYYVQVGAFSNEANAKAYLATVKNTYPDAFIKKLKEMYYVQVGAFASKINAEAFLKTVKKTYFDAFIKVM